jgi:hypothetical protein
VGWRRARRHARRWLAGHGRFYLAVGFTAVVLSYVAVPFVGSLLDTAHRYDPAYYEPKDFAREAYLEQTGRVTRAVLSWSVAFKIALLVAVGVVWRMVMPSRPSDPPSVRR